MAKQDLPNSNTTNANYTAEMTEYERLYKLKPRTQSGDVSFTSSTSGIVYNTASYSGGLYAGQGQQGMMLVLRTVLADYLLLASDLNSITDSVNQTKWYATTTNSGNNYFASLSPVPVSYTQGMRVTLQFNAATTGAPTINLSSLGAKSIKTVSGDDAILEASVYTLVYDGTNFILQGEGGLSYYFGNGSDGDLNTIGDVTLTSTLNGGPVIKQYNNLTVNTGHTLTTSNPCEGLIIYVKGNLVVNGTIHMNKKMPLTTNVSQKMISNLLTIIDPASVFGLESTKLTGAGGGGGSGGYYNPYVGPGVGGNGGEKRTFSGGIGGGGGGGSSRDYDDGTNRAGGAGSAGTGDGTTTTSSGGASSGLTSTGGGNGGGGGGGCNYPHFGTGGSAGELAGGRILIFVKGTISIGTGAIISANGGNGGSGGNCSGYSISGGGGGGGGSGGGMIIIIYNKTFSNTGSVVANGGTGGAGGSSSSTVASNNGASGGAGTVKLLELI